jgi:hypothetical protein
MAQHDQRTIDTRLGAGEPLRVCDSGAVRGLTQRPKIEPAHSRPTRSGEDFGGENRGLWREDRAREIPGVSSEKPTYPEDSGGSY